VLSPDVVRLSTRRGAHPSRARGHLLSSTEFHPVEDPDNQ